MGEKLAQLGLVSGEVRELNIGSSFRENSTFHTIRYDFKPASVDPSKMGVLTVGGDSNSSVSVNVPHMNGTGVTHFGGHAKESNKRECILIYDAETGEFTLEKISSQILLKKTRPEKGAPPENISQQPPPPPNQYPSSSLKHSSQHKKHSMHRSKPISPAHRNASPVPSRPPKVNSSMPPSHHPPPSHHHHQGPPPASSSSQYKKSNEDFSLDLDDEFDIMKSLQPVKTSPRANRPHPMASTNASSSSTSSSSTYHRQQQQPLRNQPEKKPPPPPRPPSPQAQASTGDSSDSSSSDSSSGSDSDSDDEDFQEVVSSENKSNGGSMMMMAPSMPSFSTSPNPHGKEKQQQQQQLSRLTSNSAPPSMKAILNDDLQLSSESDDDSD